MESSYPASRETPSIGYGTARVFVNIILRMMSVSFSYHTFIVLFYTRIVFLNPLTTADIVCLLTGQLLDANSRLISVYFFPSLLNISSFSFLGIR